jgi:ABC-type xylose transport system permease subunit
MIIPGVSALAACTEIAQADAAIATAAGMKPTIFENQGTTAEHNTAIENAIHQGYAAIDMGCAMDPSTGRINALGSLIAVYFLATGTAGLELLGTQSYIQQIFYGAALVAAITVPKVTRDRIFRRRRSA